MTPLRRDRDSGRRTRHSMPEHRGDQQNGSQPACPCRQHDLARPAGRRRRTGRRPAVPAGAGPPGLPAHGGQHSYPCLLGRGRAALAAGRGGHRRASRGARRQLGRVGPAAVGAVILLALARPADCGSRSACCWARSGSGRWSACHMACSAWSPRAFMSAACTAPSITRWRAWTARKRIPRRRLISLCSSRGSCSRACCSPWPGASSCAAAAARRRWTLTLLAGVVVTGIFGAALSAAHLHVAVS